MRVLIVVPNHIGDSLMAKPAIDAFLKSLDERVSVEILAKPLVAELWRSQSNLTVHVLGKGWAGTLKAIQGLRARRYDIAYVLTESMRSSVITRGSGIARRVGWGRDAAGVFLTESVAQDMSLHRALDTFRVFALPQPDFAGCLPRLSVEPALADRFLGSGTSESVRSVPLVGLLPGAARGPSKAWPVESFARVAAVLTRERGARVLVMGGPPDIPLGNAIRQAASEAVDACGRTDFRTWMSLLARCDVVVCNDSGGMHLAACLGRPVVALFGTTDPGRTGPLGKGHILLKGSDVSSERIASNSEEATRALRSIGPEKVLDAVDAVLLKSKLTLT